MQGRNTVNNRDGDNNMKRLLAAIGIMAVVLIGISGVAVPRSSGAGAETMKAPVRTGGCFCGAVRYEITSPAINQTVCHCVGCRRSSGAGAVPWITINASGFKVIQGTIAEIRSEKFPKDTCDGCGGVRSFCPKCGTPIVFKGDNRKNEVDVTVGSLDDPQDFKPAEDVFAGQRLPWVKPVK